MKLNLNEIVVGKRHRKDPGDVSGLARSIVQIGLLHPPVVDSRNRLVAGLRRLRAIEMLGWTKVPVTVAKNLDEEITALQAEGEENTCRLDMAPTEALALADLLRVKIEAEAKKRQVSGKGEDGSGGRGNKRNLVATCDKDNGKRSPKTEDRIARAVGYSSGSLRKIAEVVEAAKASPRLASVAAKMDETRKVNTAHREVLRAQAVAKIEAEPKPLPTGPFRVIVADPPWAYTRRKDDGSHRAAGDYPDMTIDEICAMSVAPLGERDSILWLWTTNAFMRDAFRVLDAWEYHEKTILTWAKSKMGTGDWLRGQTEHCILAVRGKPVVNLTNQTTLLVGPMREHSRKPDEFYRLVEALCPGSKLELFSRQKRPGWIACGAEVEKFDAR